MRGDEREIDARIDAALRSYAEPAETPEARIAVARILERARHADSAPRLWWRWGMPLPVGACLVALLLAAAVWIAQMPQPGRVGWVPEAPKGVAEAGVPSTASAPAVGKRVEDDGARSRHGASSQRVRPAAMGQAHDVSAGMKEVRELPKLTVFPTPKPLSPEEAALVKFSARSSPDVKAAVVQTAKQPDELTAVAALKLRPFNPGGDQESANDKEELP